MKTIITNSKIGILLLFTILVINQTATSQSKETISISITWLNGDGDFRLVKINSINDFSNPIDGQVYTADNEYSGLGEQIVYVGSENTVTINNLDKNQAYWYRVYEYNNEGVYTLYQTNETFNNPTNLSPESGTLPIELISFDAKLIENKIAINWVTTNEIDNEYFTIEKSKNSIDFEILEIVPASQINGIINKYNIIDYSPTNGTNYYRLKQTDVNGKTRVFSTISVNNDKNTSFSINSIQSTISNTIINISISENTKGIFKLSDLGGKVIYQQEVSSENSINQNINIQNSGVSTGLYLVSFISNESRITSKLLIP